MTIEVTDRHPVERAEEILTDDALAFVEELHTRFAGRRNELLAARGARREQAAAAQDPRLPGRDPEISASPIGPSPRPRPRCGTAGWR